MNNSKCIYFFIYSLYKFTSKDKLDSTDAGYCIIEFRF